VLERAATATLVDDDVDIGDSLQDLALSRRKLRRFQRADSLAARE